VENVISANELKTKGVSRLDEITASGDEAIITVRGKNRYVVLTLEQYTFSANANSKPRSLKRARI
jgi:hypothetical protein